MPSKDYLDYVPLQAVEKEKKKEKDTTNLVTDDTFKLMFGFEYPKVNKVNYFESVLQDPKTYGSNGKNSRFR